MRIRIEQLRKTLKYIKVRTFILAFMVIVLAAGTVTFVGMKIHNMQKEILQMNGKLNTSEATMEYNRYLLTRVDIIKMVGCSVENLLAGGADNSEIEAYLTDETNKIITAIDPETTGLYGLFNGEYLDGSGWVPDADYVPAERPWYIQTMASDKEITLVDPYLDMQTKTVMMTVSKLMPDRQSVLAMDVSLAPVQKIVEEVAASTEGGQAFLLDSKGVVIAHSDISQLGKNYMEEKDSLGGIVAHRLLDDGQMQFEVDIPEGDYVVYVDNLEGGWYSVSVINSDIWHRPLHQVIAFFSVILFLIVLAIIITFLRLLEKNIALQELHTRVDEEERRGEELQALSETDRMTGLNDRVSGERKIGDLLAAGNSGMFIELDIDHFKSINDTYGHQAGDHVIIGIADVLRKTFRNNDVIMRLGGDEFAVFAVGIVSRELGEAIINRLFLQMEKLDFPDLHGEKVCISVGAVIDPKERQLSFGELYAAADDAMYVSKKIPGNSMTFGSLPIRA